MACSSVDTWSKCQVSAAACVMAGCCVAAQAYMARVPGSNACAGPGSRVPRLQKPCMRLCPGAALITTTTRQMVCGLCCTDDAKPASCLTRTKLGVACILESTTPTTSKACKRPAPHLSGLGSQLQHWGGALGHALTQMCLPQQGCGSRDLRSSNATDLAGSVEEASVLLVQKPASVSRATRNLDTCAEALNFPQACPCS